MTQFFLKAEEFCALQVIYESSTEEIQFEVNSFSENQFVCYSNDYPEEEEFNFVFSHPELSEDIRGRAEFAGVRGEHAFITVIHFEGPHEKLWSDFFENRLQHLKARDVMREGIFAATPNDTVESVLKEMHKANAGSMLVAEPDMTPLGIFTERDVMNHVLDETFLNEPVSKYMTSNISVIEEDASVEDVYLTFRNASFRHLPVVKDGKLTGMISLRDLVRYWTKLLEIQKSNITKKYEKTMSVIVHDLRSPIYAIRSINEMLLHQLDTPESFSKQGFPKLIDESCGSMISLIDDLLEISETKYGSVSLEFSSCNLSELLTQVLETFMPSASSKDIEIKTDIDSSLPAIDLDPKRMKQVIQNVVSNAIKYTTPSTPVELSLYQKEGFAYLEVVDHGQGIKPKEIEKVFNELCKISSKPTANEPSTGLGLSIAKRIVEAHGGTISVTSEPNVETKFTIALPLTHSMSLAA